MVINFIGFKIYVFIGFFEFCFLEEKDVIVDKFFKFYEDLVVKYLEDYGMDYVYVYIVIVKNWLISVIWFRL